MRIQQPEFTDEQLERPTITDEVMHHQDQHMFIASDPYNLHPEQRGFGKQQGPRDIARQQRLDRNFPLLFSQPAKIEKLQVEFQTICDFLDRTAFKLGETRA